MNNDSKMKFDSIISKIPSPKEYHDEYVKIVLEAIKEIQQMPTVPYKYGTTERAVNEILYDYIVEPWLKEHGLDYNDVLIGSDQIGEESWFIKIVPLVRIKSFNLMLKGKEEILHECVFDVDLTDDVESRCEVREDDEEE